MIRSQRELNVTRARLADFDRAIAAFDPDKVPAGVQPAAHAAALEALRGLRADLVAEIERYQRLKSEGIAAVKIEGLAGIPHALIEGRIARGLSQAALAERLGVKPQQLQRWEAEAYENAGFAAVIDVATALGLAGCLQVPGAHADTMPSARPPAEFSWVSQIDESGAALTLVRRTPGVRQRPGHSGRIDLSEDTITVAGLGGHDGEFHRRQPLSFAWVRDETRNFSGKH